MPHPLQPLTLSLFHGDALLETLELAQPCIQIGRRDACHLRLPHGFLLHALIEQPRPGIFELIDLRPADPTLVNDTPIYRTRLHNGDIIVLGEHRIHVELDEPDLPEEQPTPELPALRPASHLGLWGFKSSEDTFVIEPRFELARRFSEGRAAVLSNGLWGFIDADGNPVIPPHFDGAGTFAEGRAAILSGGRWGYIDTHGELIISPRFDYACAFRNKRAMVRLDEAWHTITLTDPTPTPLDPNALPNTSEAAIFAALDVHIAELRELPDAHLALEAYARELEALIDTVAEPSLRSRLVDRLEVALRTMVALRHQEPEDVGEITLHVSSTPDDEGLTLQLTFNTPPPRGSELTLRLFDAEGFGVMAAAPFADSFGAFAITFPIHTSHISYFLPWCGLEHHEPGSARLLVSLSEPEERGGNELVEHTLDIHLPPPQPWDLSRVFGPLLSLMMAMAIADGVLQPIELSLVQRIAKRILRLDDSDRPALMTLLMQRATTQIDDDVDWLSRRLPHLPPAYILQLLTMVAKVNGHIHPGEVELLHEAARRFGCSEHTWRAVTHALGIPV